MPCASSRRSASPTRCSRPASRAARAAFSTASASSSMASRAARHAGYDVPDVMIYRDWRFDWLDVAALIRDAEQILEYPMVDKEPVARWTFGRVTLAGDAAHPMYPRGSNGAAQAAIDARVLADVRDALQAYEQARRETTARIVRTNREFPPDFINIKVEELVGDRPFDNLDEYITQDELRALSENYKRIAGFSLADVENA